MNFHMLKTPILKVSIILSFNAAFASAAFAQNYSIVPGQTINFRNGVSVTCEQSHPSRCACRFVNGAAWLDTPVGAARACWYFEGQENPSPLNDCHASPDPMRRCEAEIEVLAICR